MPDRYRSALGRFIAGCALALASLVGATPVSAQGPKRVLLLFDEDRSFPGLAVLDQGFRAALTTALGNNVEFFAESMNLSQFNDEGYDDTLASYYQQKYHDRHLDLVVPVMGPALKFVLNHGDDVFPRVPIVFAGVDPADLQDATLPKRATGVLIKRAFGPTLEQALQLKPATKHFFVVGGTSEFDQHLLAQARREFQPFESKVSIDYLNGLAMAPLLQKIAQLPPDSAVLFVSMFRDAAGQGFVPHFAAARIAETANTPVYIFVDQYLGNGTVGGHVYSVEQHGAAAAKLALRIFHGEPPSAIAVSGATSMLDVYDARQLARWRLDEARLPAGAVIRFREPGLWERYRSYTVIALSLMLTQAALIGALLVQRKQRQRAESDLRASFDRIRELGGRLLHAQEEERAHIARELHDDVSQQLAQLKIDLDVLGHTLQGPDAEVVAEEAKRTADIATSIHNLSHRLHPTRLRIIGLVSALESLAAECSRPGMVIALAHDAIPRSLPPEISIPMFRIAQEALQNALKHSQARKVSMRLARDAKALTLTITDDGVGFDTATAWQRGSGLGLISMRERIEVMGGSCEIASRPRAGTTIRVRAPFPEHLQDVAV